MLILYVVLVITGSVIGSWAAITLYRSIREDPGIYRA